MQQQSCVPQLPEGAGAERHLSQPLQVVTGGEGLLVERFALSVARASTRLRILWLMYRARTKMQRRAKRLLQALLERTQPNGWDRRFASIAPPGTLTRRHSRST